MRSGTSLRGGAKGRRPAQPTLIAEIVEEGQILGVIQLGLPMAVGILAAEGLVLKNRLKEYLMAGEL